VELLNTKIEKETENKLFHYAFYRSRIDAYMVKSAPFARAHPRTIFVNWYIKPVRMCRKRLKAALLKDPEAFYR